MNIFSFFSLSHLISLIFNPSWRVQPFNDLRGCFESLIYFVEKEGRFFSNDPSFSEHPIVIEGKQVKKTLSPLFETARLREDLYLIEVHQIAPVAIGYNFTLGQRAHAAIAMPKGLRDLDPESYNFLLRHEISHIKNSDALVSSLLCFVALTGALFCLKSIGTAFWLQFFLVALFAPIVNFFVRGLWLRYRERAADNFAIAHSTDKEIEGGIRFFTAFKSYACALSATTPLYNSDGESTQDISHPTLASRIERLQKNLEKRKKARYTPEKELIAKHLDLFEENSQAIKNLLASA